MPEVITRAEAKAQGLKRFFTGRPCINGQIAERYMSGGCTCRTCLSTACEKVKARYKADPTQTRARVKKWVSENRDRAQALTSKWAKENPQKVRASKSEWGKRNVAYVRAKTRARQASKISATPPWFSDWDEFVIEEAYEAARRRTTSTGFPWDVDHMIPLQAESCCGLHVAHNIQVIPARVNRVKKNQLIYTEPLQWLEFYGR